MTNEDKSLTYEDAGVNTAECARSVDAIRDHVQSTYRPEVIGDIGGFGGLFSIAAAKGMGDPVLVSGADGVGTKIRIAQLMDRHDTVGIDLVAMCANDVAVAGAEPLFFLDYIAIGKLTSEKAEALVSGVAEGCRQAGCSLVGGEMAEHTGVMDPDDYDLSGFCVGLVDRAAMLDKEDVQAGDRILGLASTGVHSNGFSLVRRVCLVEGDDEASRAALEEKPEELGGTTLGEALLEPTRIYAKTIAGALEAGVPIVSVAHITGGGITENLDRVLTSRVDAVVDRDSWEIPPVIEHVVSRGNMSRDDAYRTFNMGVGMAVICRAADVDEVVRALTDADESVFPIGEVVEGTGKVLYR